ncbi:LTA synthase family protein [Candidatus Nitrospira neomarina]|uniref:LTA synthase family protein n=1 Tax=Candidatus Nitrospira neomarina TaxID=3020899 RepID=A0AA96GK17_9BACT|nr:LTA synthase family protein [Candidatus Nitrospira neomarina]WNM63879.1 LTA synthase family protein [Candidatus Nitrospira neomarina]
MNRFLGPHEFFPLFKHPRSLAYLLSWWAVILIGIQQAERWFLLPYVIAKEPPTISLLGKTLLLGVLSDGVTASAGILLAMILALSGIPLCLFMERPPGSKCLISIYRRTLQWALILLGALFLMSAMVDASYYRMFHHHLNFPFFEYVDEAFQASRHHTESQGSNQTIAELAEAGSWLRYLITYFLLLALTILTGIWGMNRLWSHSIFAYAQTTHFQFRAVLFAVPFALGAAAWSPLLPEAFTLQIESPAYHNLAQNPILSASRPLQEYLRSQGMWTPAQLSRPMSANKALTVTHQILAPSAIWPSTQFPLIKEQSTFPSFMFPSRVNILLLLVEGLDRRFLGKILSLSNPAQERTNLPSRISLTPFLNSLRQDSVYFEHFFSNGVQTTRGLLATLCSVFPRQGTAVIKTRNTHEYLCFPSVLQKAGYRTEMMMGLDSDIPGSRTFLARNGIEQISGGQDFPAGVERMGIGLTDGALLDGLYQRVAELQQQPDPYFLAALTTGTHHPFTIPLRHPEVRALKDQPDPYLAALRNFDLEFSRVFAHLKRDGLLTNTILFVLGDHGRHEAVGFTEGERVAGHFSIPLFIWMDEALRTQLQIVPHTVTTVASQVDIAPTILSLTGLTPNLTPFMGRDLTCLLIKNCLSDNLAYLSNMYDDAIGLADHQGIWWYAFDTGLLNHTDLDLQTPVMHPSLDEIEAAHAYRSMIGLYLTANTLIEYNRIWSRGKIDSPFTPTGTLHSVSPTRVPASTPGETPLLQYE